VVPLLRAEGSEEESQVGLVPTNTTIYIVYWN